MVNQERLHQLFTYNVGGYLVNRYSRGLSKAGKVAGYLSQGGSGTGRFFWSIKVDRHIYQSHRLIWIYHYGECPIEIDHVNRSRLDNRLENLRPANRIQNLANARLSERNCSGYRGVSLSEKKRKWRARFTYDGKLYFIGHFYDAKEAYEAVQTKRQEIGAPLF